MKSSRLSYQQYSLTILILFLNIAFCFGQNDCVYLSGTVAQGARNDYVAYWRSGQLTKHTNGSDGERLTAIAVSGNDVHVAGYVGARAVYWKNGQQMPLHLEGEYFTPPAIYALKALGTDVYMFATQPDFMNKYYYYKNGKAVKILLTDADRKYLDSYQGGVYSQKYFVTANGDVYEAGVVFDRKDTRSYVVYRKNGHIVAEHASVKYPPSVTVSSIFVSGNGDVYVAGWRVTDADPDVTKRVAVYWKNGKEVVIDSWETEATSIYVQGNDVYVAGNDWGKNNHSSAVYWKNGQKTTLKSDKYYGYGASFIAVANGTVYVAGGGDGIVYWVNGKEAKIAEGKNAKITEMVVVPGGGCVNNTQSVTAQNYQNGAAAQPQQYGNALNQAQTSLQNGNYTQAMQGYVNAASTANGTSERQLATAGVVVSGLTGLADAMQKSSKEKQERQQRQAEAASQKAKEDAKKELEQLAKTEDARKQVEEQDKIAFEKAVPVKSGKEIGNNVTLQYVINKNIDAIGGIQKLEAVKNIYKYTESDLVKTQSVIAYGKVAFNNIYSSGTKGKTVFNGIRGYTVSNNKKIDLDSKYINIYKGMIPVDILALQQTPDLLLGDLVTFRGKECYTIIEKGDVQKRHFFDTLSGLWIGTEQLSVRTNNGKSVSYVCYEDHREVDGILFPFTQRIFIQYPGFNGENRYTSSITKTTEIKINQPLTDKDFE